MSKTNLKQKTREWLKNKGAIVGNTEFWNKYSRKSVDLFNLFDLVAIYKSFIWGVQITNSSNFANHHKKMIQNDILWYWLDTDQRAILVAWGKKKIKRGGKKYKWVVKVREYYLADSREEPYSKWKTESIKGKRVIWRDFKKGGEEL